MSNKIALIVGEAFYPEDFIINDLIKEWQKFGYNFEVLTRTPSYPYGKIYKGYKNRIYQQTYYNGIKIHRFPVIPGYTNRIFIKVLNYLSFVFWGSLIALFIGRKYDKVFVYQTGPLTLAIPAIIVKIIYKAPITIWTTDLWPDTVYAFGFKKTLLLKWFLETLVKYIYKNCSHIIVSCNGFIPKIQQYTNNTAFYWIPNWPIIKYEPKGIIQFTGKFNFTFAGNIGKVQNLENVILGFELFVYGHKDCYLNIIGDGSQFKILNEFVRQRKIININFMGHISLNEMAEYFQASDVLVISLIDSPIYELTIPSKFQTYLSTSKPILGVIKGEVKTLIEENGIGFTALPDSPKDIALSFEKFINITPNEIERISINSYNLLESSFSRTKLIEKMTKIFWA